MSNWEHVDKEEIIISEEGLDEAIDNAYLKGRNDVLDKIIAEIEKVFCMSVVTNELRTPMEVKTEILQIIDKYMTERNDKG